MEILSLGEKIKRKRKELSMTLKDLAGDRITPGQISLVESGRSNPSMDLLEYLANTLDTSVEYLMESEKTQAEKICLFFEQTAERYILEGNQIKAEQHIESALYYAEKYNLEYRKAKNLYLRAEIYLNEDDYTLAQQFFLAANVLFIKTSSYADMVNTYLKVGKLSLESKAYHSSNSYLKEAEKIYIANKLTEDTLLGEIHYYLSKTYFLLDDIRQAMNFAFLAKEEFVKVYDKKKYAQTLALLSEEYNEAGEIENSIIYSKKSLEIYRELNQEDNISEIENSLGKLFYEFDNIEESFMHYEKAKKMREDSNDDKLVDTLINICENYIKLKEIDKCYGSLKAIKEKLESDDVEKILDYNFLNYRVALLEENVEKAEFILLDMLHISEKNELDKRNAEICIILGKFYLDLKRDYESAKYLDKGINSLKKIGIIKN
ncbi:helix-turn-helix domain-containing protein [uncultured Clostridium sp.]|jgi:transcriptional regulator with XRE-family HTH domain|uniref:helix-turn-helix domain-containing protein n=1 Tax=uncultured Clostridium sp. TaxID=59620 RepID=UPI0026102014|nr:helix-turn-helix domain-containing protein [uncultured Clostridium sp.]